MESSTIQRMQQEFDAIAHEIPGEEVEFWFARELQEPLGYARWENFTVAIRRAIESCETEGYTVSDHFRGVTKMIRIGEGWQRDAEKTMRTIFAWRRMPNPFAPLEQ